MPDNLGYHLLLLVTLTTVNAFFAGSEVALLSCSRSKLDALAAQKNLGALAAVSLLANTERLLSVVQVGVTLTSLGMGWAGEETIYRALQATFEPLIPEAWQAVGRVVSLVLSFLLLTLALVVFGEVVPKNLAIDKAERVAMLVSPILLLFYRIVGPFVYIVEKSSTAISRLLGLKGEIKQGGHSTEELKFMIGQSGDVGHLGEFEEEAIAKLLDLRHIVAREVMVPRTSMVSLPLDASFTVVLKVMSEQLYSRVPVYEGTQENIVGVVHFRDMLAEWRERRKGQFGSGAPASFNLARYLRRPLVTPETKALGELLGEFRTQQAHMAIVVDEFGTVTGLITLEDVLEQVFGEIEDEHDLRHSPTVREGGVLHVDGTTTILDLATHYGIELPGDAGFETLAGFLLYRLGHIPEEGESVEADGRVFTIETMERNRIARVRAEKRDVQ